MIDVEPWLVAADVCKALEIKNSRDAISSLDEDEKMTVVITDSHSGQRGGARSMSTSISEPGLYSLILRSRKPEAKTFCTFVTVQVRPTPFAEDVKAFFAFLLTGGAVNSILGVNQARRTAH